MTNLRASSATKPFAVHPLTNSAPPTPPPPGGAFARHRPLPAAVSLALAIAYLISYGLRTVNAAIAPTLTREFGLDAADLGLLTAAYFCHSR